jgi:hypothetical protein
MQVSGRGKWICDRCRWERARLLEEKLLNTLLETEDLRRKYKRMEEQVIVAAEGSEVKRFHRLQGHHDEKCSVMVGSVIRNVGTERRNIVVECFHAIRIHQMHRVLENRDLGHPTPKIKKKYSRYFYNKLSIYERVAKMLHIVIPFFSSSV